MTDKKPKPEVLKVLDEFYETNDVINLPQLTEEIEQLATLAYEQGKFDLFTVDEVSVLLILAERHDDGTCGNPETYRNKKEVGLAGSLVKKLKMLKSQLSKSEKKDVD
jgi:hypothetical protein